MTHSPTDAPRIDTDLATPAAIDAAAAAEHETEGDPSGLTRRSMLQASVLSVGLLPVLADDGGRRAPQTPAAVDTPVGFKPQVLSPYATFPDDVAAKFRINYGAGGGARSNLSEAAPDDAHGRRTVVSSLTDASTVVFAKVTWAPEGTSGWHTHPGPVIVSVAQGSLELTNERDCVTRTYEAGQAFIDPGDGNVHVAANPSTTDQTVAYAAFLGVPHGGSPTIMVAPVDC